MCEYEGLFDEAEEKIEDLKSTLEHYRQVCKEEGIDVYAAKYMPRRITCSTCGAVFREAWLGSEKVAHKCILPVVLYEMGKSYG